MIDSIEQKLKEAQFAKGKDAVVSHPEKVKKAAISYMEMNNVTETPVIKANGYKVVFKDPQNLKMYVEGREFSKELSTEFSGRAINSAINRIDLIGPDMQKERDKKRIKGIAEKETKNLASIAKVSAVRNVVAAPVRMTESGHRTVGSLLHGLWNLMKRAMER